MISHAENPAAYMRSKNAQRRASRKAIALCVDCFNPSAGKTRCEECTATSIAKNTERVRNRRFFERTAKNNKFPSTMILQKMTVTGAHDDSPNESKNFIWEDGMPLADLETAIEIINRFVATQKRRSQSALNPSLPIAT